jgi:hypothetical protein
MRSLKFALMIVSLSVAAVAQQPARSGAKAAKVPPAASSDSTDRQKLHESAMNFMQASDARQRLEKSLDKLLEDGKQAMMQKNPGLAPEFGDEWLKKMRQRVSLDQFVITTAQVYEKYFTSVELDQLTWEQLAFKKGAVYPLAPQLADKLKSNSPHIQQDINQATSSIGGRLGSEVGKEIEKEHPEWITKLNTNVPPAKKT